MKVIPVSEFGRAPQQGRIRYGIRQNGIPRSILKFRFTSSDVTALNQIAELYGGTVKPWEKGQSEVVSAVSEIPIVLPPDPLGDGAVYELWKGSTCVRRCDGVNAFVPVKTQEGADLVEVPCICSEQDALECKPTTRLQVILPDVRFAGVWRLDCKGFYGTQELPGMVALAQQFQGRGMSRAFLALEQRSGQGNKKFVVPVIRLDKDVNTMLGTTELGLEPMPPPQELDP